MHLTCNRSGLLLIALAAIALALSKPAAANISVVGAGFEVTSGGFSTGTCWPYASPGNIARAANGSGGKNTAMFDVSNNGTCYVGIADDSSGVFHGAAWKGVDGASTTPPGGFFDSGAAQGLEGHDIPWSINDSDVAVGQGIGQCAGYDDGFFACIEWISGGAAIVDINCAVSDPAGNAINTSNYYGGPIYIEGYDFTGLGLRAAAINNNGCISAVSFQNFGNMYYQGVIICGGKVYVIPYTDSSDPAATSWGISSSSATCGYNFSGGLTVAYGYTATVNTSGYTFGANGGSGALNNYGSGPNNNFIWGLDTNDTGNGFGQLVGFDLDSTGSYNHAIYCKNSFTSVEIADDRGGNTAFLIGVANDGSSVGAETIAADGEAYFHGWATLPGTPGATIDYPEGSGIVGSKEFAVSSGGGGLAVTTFTGAEKTVKGHPTFKPIVLKHAATAKVSIVLSANGPQVVTVTSSNTADLANFTATVPSGQNFVYNVKTPKVGKKAKGHTITLTASAPGGSQSVTVTIK